VMAAAQVQTRPVTPSCSAHAVFMCMLEAHMPDPPQDRGRVPCSPRTVAEITVAADMTDNRNPPVHIVDH